jgi:serine protease Do
MDRARQWIQAAGVALTLAIGETGWTFEPQFFAPGPPPPPPGPERVVIARGSGSFLGIGVQEIDSERAKALNLHEERGVEVTRVEDDSPAAKGGIRVGDVVLEYNGDRVEGVEEFMRMVRETPPGREVKLAITRNGAAQQLSMKTGSRKTWMTTRYGEAGALELPHMEFPEINVPDVPRAFMSWRSSIVGIEAESLDSQLAEYFGVKEGVLVRSVVRGSSAEKAGLRAGDVIVKVDDTRVSSPREISANIRSSRAKKAVPVQVIRDKREVTLQLPMDDSTTPTYNAMPKPGPTRK